MLQREFALPLTESLSPNVFSLELSRPLLSKIPNKS
jgi:hypothetical protein